MYLGTKVKWKLYGKVFYCLFYKFRIKIKTSLNISIFAENLEIILDKISLQVSEQVKCVNLIGIIKNISLWLKNLFSANLTLFLKTDFFADISAKVSMVSTRTH